MVCAVPGNGRGLTHDRRRVPQAVRETWLYVSYWGTGELNQYDMTTPHAQRSGLSPPGRQREPHPTPRRSELPMGATPDGGGEPRRAARVVDQLALRLLGRDLLPARHRHLDGPHRRGGMTLGARFFRHGDDFHGLRVHQIRLQAEDASSDSFWFVQ